MEHSTTPPAGELAEAEEIDLMRMCEELALAARAHVLARTPVKVQVLATKSTATDVVTQMDKEVETLLRTLIRESRPDDGFLGEEADNDSGSRSGYTWVVDPIDGTVNYLYGLPGCSVSVAVVRGEPTPATWTQVAGAVIHLGDGTLWKAARGHGAFCDERRLEINRPEELSMCLTGTGFGYARELRELQARVLVGVLPQVRDIRRFGSAAVELCHLAQGATDLFFERGLNAWDVAAGSLIAAEAGAAVEGINGGASDKLMTIAGWAPRVREIAEILRECDATQKL